jgi:uncharacterized coiled-coil DUF342 family protein
VDEDIYNIQERKAKMNDAIMENDEWKKKADKTKSDVLKATFDRFLHTSAHEAATSSQ